jgi:hypothetical protein
MQMKKLKSVFAKILRPWIATSVVMGFIPAKIGRYRVLDVLVVWAEDKPE